MSKKELVEGIDFIWSKVEGLKFRVFTEKFLLERGYCCHGKCKNCPYKKGEKIKT